MKHAISGSATTAINPMSLKHMFFWCWCPFSNPHLSTYRSRLCWNFRHVYLTHQLDERVAVLKWSQGSKTFQNVDVTRFQKEKTLKINRNSEQSSFTSVFQFLLFGTDLRFHRVSARCGRFARLKIVPNR